jgi:tetratricopeptide (TPR) repeat protein
MKRIGVMGLVLSLLVCSMGCSSSPKSTEVVPERSASERFEERVSAAYAQLELGNPERAMALASEAETLVQGLGVDRTACDLVKAEAALMKDRLDEATCLAEAVREGDAWNAAASEILGRVALRRGDLEAAEQIFQAARQKTNSEAARERLTDLIALVAGLQAYGRADLEVAQRHWAGIRSSEVRYAVDVALRGVTE